MSVVLAGSEASDAALNRGGAHINIGGPARYHPGLLHAAPTYLWGFWYLDDLGVHWQSSIRLSDFPGEALPWDPAQYFFDGVSGHMLEHNVSKLPQPAREGQSPAFAAVFCQDIEDHWPRSHYLTTVEIIRNTARAAGGRGGSGPAASSSKKGRAHPPAPSQDLFGPDVSQIRAPRITPVGGY